MLKLTNTDIEAPRRLLTLLASVLAMLALWCFLESRGAAQRKAGYRDLVAQTERMALDTQAIKALRNAPRLATERQRPNDELLQQVRDALEAAEIPSEHWIGNEPSAPVRVAKTPYKRLNTRLSLENVHLKRLVAFAHTLVAGDPSLTVSGLRVSTPRSTESDGWNVELAISYLIYSPYQRPTSPPTGS